MNIFKKIKNKIVEVIKQIIPDKIAEIKALDFKFGNTTELAKIQDALIIQYKSGNKTISKQQMDDLKNNPWITLAARIAPNNLVIRQYCLIDLFSAKAENTINIYKLLYKLSYGSKIWAEGYSYWLYVRDVLDLWTFTFNNSDVVQLISDVDLGFFQTSYLRNQKWYPAPFGDLRDICLLESLQIEHEIKLQTIGNVTLKRDDSGNLLYEIIGKPIGLNTHIPKDNYSISMTGGIPKGFKFYNGYDKKYLNVAEEWADTFDAKRIQSI